ncbi:hypothetical protein QTG54_003819 [Skeletonema marinoi]|uniref:Uncharacterized protein n=1 Tax=Skeletonema marinoi TaxID=267567 RepID=A0AAD8YIX2_9STRA|nr:hypothetical protein QTG54_003819 [Skeletonema marinoi]
MSASPRKKFPTLHTAMECTSPPTNATTTPTNSSSTPPNISLQRESDNASPPTVPYTMDDMNTGINHIITEAMVREQLSGASPTNNNNSIPTPTTKDSKESPSQRILKGLSCGTGSYGQQLLLAPTNVMESVPVEDVKRWKEFRRKQKTIAATATTTEIDVDGFPVSEEYSSTIAAGSHDGDGEDGIPKQQLVLATSTSNSEVGTEIASNTARYLAKQSNIMARQLMSSSEEGEEEEQGDDDTEDWGPPLDVGDDWDSPLNDDDNDGGQEEVVSTVEDYDMQNSVESHVVNDEGGIQPSLQSQQPLPLEEASAAASASSPKKEVPTMDEVHNFMNQLKQKSAVGRERNIKYSKSGDSNNTTDMYSSSNSKLSSSSHAVNEESDINPPSTTTSSAEVHKSLIEHKERMRQQKLEGQRKRQEFDARLQLLRSQLHDEAVDARLQLLRSKLHDGDNDDDGLIVPTSVCDDSADAHQTVEQWEREVRENNNNQQKQSSMPVLPGARWSGGLAVWSPSNGGGVGGSTMRSKPTPSPSRHDDSNPKHQQQQQQNQSTPLQLLPPTGIGIDEDDFSFSPVDIDAVLGKSSGSSIMSPPNEGGQSSTECLELFSEAYGGEAKRSGTNDAVDDDQAKASKSSSSPAVKDSIMENYYSKGQSRIVNRPPKSPPPSSDASPPISNGSTAITEGDKGGGLGSGYVSGFGDKSLASSVNVELGYGVIGVDPPRGDDDDDSSEKEDENLLGKTVVGSKRRKRKSNSPWTSCETVEEQSKDGLKEDGSDVEDGGDEYRRDPSPVTLEPTSRDAPYERKQLDPDGIVWNDIDVVKREPRSSEPTTPSRIGRKTVDANLEEMDNDQVCPDNIFSSKNDNLPPVTPRMTPQARDGQWNSGSHFTPRSKKLPTPRATPRTARAANLSSKKFGFGSEDDSTDMSFKMNEKPLARRDNRVDEASDESSQANVNDDAQQNNAGKDTSSGNHLQTRAFTESYHSSEMDASIVDKECAVEDVMEKEQVENQILTKHTSIKDIQSKFESNTFGIDHLQKSLQNIREEKVVGASKIPVKANLLDSPRKDSNTPSRIYLVDRDLRAMSSLETDTHVSIEEYSLNKGVSDDNDATIGDSTLGAGTMDTKKALRYAKRLENLNESEDNSKENHEEEETPSIVAQRRKAFENQANGSIQNSQDRRNTLDTVGSQRDKRSLSSRRSHLNASKSEESCHVHKKPSQDYSSFSQKPSRDYSSVSQSSPGGKSSVVASIKERIAAYDGQNSTNGKPSPYRLSGQSQTFQIRVGGQVKSVSIQNSARRQGVTSLQKANSITTAGAAVGKEKTLPTRTLNQDKQIPNNSGEHRIQYGGASFPQNQPSSNQNQATGRQHRSEMPRVAPIDTRFDYHTHDDDDDGITLSPTISEVSGLTFETSLVAGGVPEEDVNKFERTMTPIARLRQKTQGNRFSNDHADAPTPRTSVQTNRPSRRDQIVSRIRESSSNGNLWQRRNVVTEVSHSTSGDASGKSRNATMGNSYSISSTQGKVAEKVANFDRPRGNERVNVSVGDRVAMMNRHSQQHKTRHRNSMSDEPSSSLATRDCIRVD